MYAAPEQVNIVIPEPEKKPSISYRTPVQPMMPTPDVPCFFCGTGVKVLEHYGWTALGYPVCDECGKGASDVVFKDGLPSSQAVHKVDTRKALAEWALEKLRQSLEA
jgi:hypothetical protein